MRTTSIYYERLNPITQKQANRIALLAQDLYEHPENFDFDKLRQRKKGTKRTKPCGTVACAMGRMPDLFPKEAVSVIHDTHHGTDFYSIRLKSESDYSDEDDVVETLLGLPSILFYPRAQGNVKRPNGSMVTQLSVKASAKSVADMLVQCLNDLGWDYV